MSSRCDAVASLRRGTVAVRCDRTAGHDTMPGEWHYDLALDAEWRWTVAIGTTEAGKALCVEYREEPASPSPTDDLTTRMYATQENN